MDVTYEMMAAPKLITMETDKTLKTEEGEITKRNVHQFNQSNDIFPTLPYILKKIHTDHTKTQRCIMPKVIKSGGWHRKKLKVDIFFFLKV